MIVRDQIPLHRLILSLSDALGYVNAEVANHQKRVAYVVMNMALARGLREGELVDLFYAAALHDIGMVRVGSEMRYQKHQEMEDLSWHPEVGYMLLHSNPMFARAAELLRFHHVSWDGGRGQEHWGREVPAHSYILAVADAVERCIDRRVPVLEQVESVRGFVQEGAGNLFEPEAAELFLSISGHEAFWLDVASEHIYSRVLNLSQLPQLSANEDTVLRIARTFGRIVDAQSAWTAAHTAGVAASAVALAGEFGFSERELTQMRTAGYLHDLGKLSVPACILDKPGRPDESEWAQIRTHTYHTYQIIATIGGMQQINEWASFHHERLDGGGYPFGHAAKDLTLGSRLMAVADIFTALKEDRPYRDGLDHAKVCEVLDRQAASGAIDGDVVSRLQSSYETVDQARRREQELYLQWQQCLVKTINHMFAEV
jgi:HD-GYP domain-containing protein (c-di-GMP phosphodiesterase class II)